MPYGCTKNADGPGSALTRTRRRQSGHRDWAPSARAASSSLAMAWLEPCCAAVCSMAGQSKLTLSEARSRSKRQGWLHGIRLRPRLAAPPAACRRAALGRCGDASHAGCRVVVLWCRRDGGGRSRSLRLASPPGRGGKGVSLGCAGHGCVPCCEDRAVIPFRRRRERRCVRTVGRLRCLGRFGDRTPIAGRVRVDAEFPADVREGLGIGQAAVGHHRPQRGKPRVGEEQPGRPGCWLQAHEAAPKQALGDGRHLGLSGRRAAAPGPELEAVGDAGQGREELVELTADVVPLTRREDRGRCRQGYAHGGSIAPRAVLIRAGNSPGLSAGSNHP